MKKIILFIILGFVGSAQAAAVYNTDYDQMQKARQRVYPGGRDEQDLIILEQIPVPPRTTGAEIELEALESSTD